MIVIVKNPGKSDEVLKGHGLVIVNKIDRSSIQQILAAGKLIIEDHFKYSEDKQTFGGFALLADLFDAKQIPVAGIRFFTYSSSSSSDERLRVLQDAQISGSYKMPDDQKYFYDHILRCTTQRASYFLRRYNAALKKPKKKWRLPPFIGAIKAALF